jgi:hypothetical protein
VLDQAVVPDSGQPGYIVLNITAAIMQWLRHRGTLPARLRLQVLDAYGKIDREWTEEALVVPGAPGTLGASGDWQCFGVASFHEGNEHAHRRMRRDTSNDAPGEEGDVQGYSLRPDPLRDITYHRGCRRRSLYVSFKDLGWEVHIPPACLFPL